MGEIKYKRPYLTNYQKDILDAPARYTVTEASTKVGKTASHIVWLFEKALQGKAGQNFWWIAPVFGQAEIAFNRMKRQVTDPNFFQVNHTKLVLTLPTGAEIHFKSAERPDNLYGEDVYAAVFDEFTRAREAAWFALRSTLTATKAPCKFIGNVRGKGNWGYKMARKAKMNEDPEYQHFLITAHDAVREGILDAAEIEQARRDLPEAVFKELYEAIPADNSTNPFGDAFIAQCTYPMTMNFPVCYGVDLAKSVDYTVIIGLDKGGGVCFFDRFQKDWRMTIETMKALPGAGVVPMLVDSTGVGDPVVEEVQHYINNVEGFKYSQISKQQIMQGLAVAIQRRAITFPEGPITEELYMFEYVYTQTGVKYAAPDGFHDDCVNALALAWKKHGGAHFAGQYSFM
jgi:Terminase large subunit, T4likevirus-type, N-terminal/Terminase RNaseH-like domain